MIKLSRLGFFKKTSAGAAAVGLLTMVPGFTAASESEAVDSSELSPEVLGAPLLAHVRDIASGEVAIMSGVREFIVRDPRLVASLLKAVR